jgi:hypothetical protein
MPSQNPVGKTYKPTRFMRHPLTGRNQEELGIPAKADALLAWEGKTWRGGYKVPDYVKAKAQKKTPNERDRWVTPTGFSLNKRRYGAFPQEEKTAHQRGWYAFMNMGIPLIEMRGDIVQPPPDVISEQTYVNRTDPVSVTWTNSVEFSISNTINWSLEGQVQLTFGARTAAELQAQLQKSLQHSVGQKTSHTDIDHQHKDDVGTEKQDQTEKTTTDTSTTTVTGTATGTGELSAQLMLGITASVSGSLTTSWTQTSTLSGTIESRAVVRATQRRQVKRFDYEIPIVFGGYVALYYPEPVEFATVTAAAGMDILERTRVQNLDPKGKTTAPQYTQTIVHPIDILGLIEDGQNFTQKGAAEVVSTLTGEHEVFELENLQHGNRYSDNVEAHFYKP